MAFADYDAYLAALTEAGAADFMMSASVGAAARFADCTGVFLPAPSVPTTSTALTKTSARATNTALANGGTGRLSILGGQFDSVEAGAALMVVDILNMSGGMSGIVTGEQTTNLPTAALTRYTTGDNVQAAIIIHSALGSTATTFTARYTNQGGTGSRATTAINIGGAANNAAGSLLRFPLQVGDSGIRSVQGVTLAATTGTAGNFGVVMYRPLAMMFVNEVEGAKLVNCVSTGRMVGQCNEVLDDACLAVFMLSTRPQIVSGTIFLGEA